MIARDYPKDRTARTFFPEDADARNTIRASNHVSVLPRRHATLDAETHAARSDGLCVRKSPAAGIGRPFRVFLSSLKACFQARSQQP